MVTSHLKKIFSKETVNLTISLLTSDGDADHIYTTGDRIEGKISVRLTKDLKRDASLIGLQIALIGRTTVKIQNLNPWAGGHASQTKVHTFLAMHEERSSKDIRDVYTKEGSSRYEAGFAFVVPDKLLPSACKHNADDSSLVIDSHIHLPPTFNAPGNLADVSYAVRVRARSKINGKVNIAEGELPVQIIPVSSGLSASLPRYSLQPDPETIDTRLDLSHGRVSAMISQAPTLRIISSHPGGTTTTMSALEINSLFESIGQQLRPPRLITIQNKLHAYTYTSLTPFENEPVSEDFSDYDVGKWISHESMQLSSHLLDTIEWKPTTNQLGQKVYSTSLQVHLNFTEGEESHSSFLLPSFSSCIISRNYFLETNLSYNYPGSVGKSKKSLIIKTPVHVMATTSLRSENPVQLFDLAAMDPRPAAGL